MAAKIAPEERLLNLVVALMATEQGLTKDTILSTVAGFREQLEAGAKKDALEKMFERDKEALRRLGVPIETIGDYADPEDLREARYRVPTGEYELPLDIDFTSQELAVLNLAGSVWSEGSLSRDAQSGLRKIRALGFATDEPIIGFAPRISQSDAAFAPLQEAIEDTRHVRFQYFKPGDDDARVRHVQPFALVDYEGRWHMTGWDLDRGAERTFLLSRIVGDVVVTSTSYDPELREGAGDRALASLRAVADRNVAHLEVHPGTEAALRLGRRARAAVQGIEVPFVDVHVFADELASYGPEVRVVSPPELRDAVIARLRATATLHEGVTS